MTELTLKQKEKFFKNQEKVGTVVISHIKKRGLILFGQKAINRQLPKDLRKDTEDYDIFSPTPEKSAKRIEMKLDKKFKGNYFVVKPALHGGTYKVKSIIGDKGIADVSKLDRKVPTVTRKGVKVATLQFQKEQIRKSLKDKHSAFRHAKDKEVRARIQLAELRKKKNKPTKSRRPKSVIPAFNVSTKVDF